MDIVYYYKTMTVNDSTDDSDSNDNGSNDISIEKIIKLKIKIMDSTLRTKK